MSTIKVDTVRPVTADASLTLQGDNSGTGVSGITIDSSGNTALGGVLKLKSSGNSITASDGTTAVLSESAGVATLANTTLASTNTFPAGTIIDVGQPIQNVSNSSNQSASGNVPDTSFSITVNSGNYVLIQYNFTFIKNTGSGTTGHVYLSLYGGGLGASPGTQVTNALGYNFSAETRDQCTISHLDINPGTNPTYGLYADINNTMNLRIRSIHATYYEIQA